LRLDDFDFELPPELIAQTPAARRDAARLLVVRPDGGVEHRGVRELPGLLPADALVVVNDARVVPARLFAKKPTGGRVELLLVERGADETWRCLVRGQKALAPGTPLELLAPRGRAPAGPPPAATYVGDGQVRFAAPILPALDDWGELPLPPYVERAAGPTADDRERYQTLFARVPGAVAAPTAGLHLTAEMLAELAPVPVTLHVGPGTFAPVRTDDILRHEMHEERYDVPPATAAAYDAARAAGRPIVAIGTTVVRTLESALDPDGRLRPGPGATRLFLHPGRPVRAVDVLVTNFHMPRSTLFMLVCAFAGLDRVRAAYRAAVAERYRFFSYGDATLMFRKP
jgi:S-adenosylmethionine:tRNA ribosyltransferase-isomerase